MKEITLPDMSALTFDDGPHIYRLDGIEIPSVTTIMKPLSDGEYKDIPDSVLENAAKKGTSVHECIESYIKYGITDIEEEYLPFFNAFKAWENEYNPKYIASELYVYHPLFRYAGTLDILAEINEELILIDTKTTYKCLEKNCRVQLEAYSKALEYHGIKPESKAVLHLKNNGEYKFPVYGPDIIAWKTFTALKTIYDYLET